MTETKIDPRHEVDLRQPGYDNVNEAMRAALRNSPSQQRRAVKLGKVVGDRVRSPRRQRVDTTEAATEARLARREAEVARAAADAAVARQAADDAAARLAEAEGR
jgi:hypothetical protein